MIVKNLHEYRQRQRKEVKDVCMGVEKKRPKTIM